MDKLPRDILQLIAKKLIQHIDVLRVAVVCKQWHSVIMDNLHLLPPQLPLSLCLPNQRRSPLLMQFRNADEEGMIDYLSLSNNKRYGGFFLPEISRKWVAGSSNGWLSVIEIGGQKIQLLNPLTRAQISLPPLSTFHSSMNYGYEVDDFSFMVKIIVSGDPKRSDDCIVMAIVANLQVLSFCRPGDDKWTNVENCPVHISDVIPYKGRFYAITKMGSVVACDATGGGNAEVVVVGTCRWEKRYLVESTTGDLLQVERIMEYGGRATEYFVVYKLEAVDGAKKKAGTPERFEELCTIDDKLVTTQQVTRFQWVELESLGDLVLFLGHGSSLALAADAVPGCRRNCIYFTDDNDDFHMCFARGIETRDADSDAGEMVLSDDNGLYDMDDGSIESLWESKDKTFVVPPIWVLPSP